MIVAHEWQSITPNDTTLLSPLPIGFYIGDTGVIRLQDKKGNTEDFQIPAAGWMLPFKAIRVYATGTTVTDVIALYWNKP
jgi:hypothetical protein